MNLAIAGGEVKHGVAIWFCPPEEVTSVFGKELQAAMVDALWLCTRCKDGSPAILCLFVQKLLEVGKYSECLHGFHVVLDCQLHEEWGFCRIFSHLCLEFMYCQRTCNRHSFFIFLRFDAVENLDSSELPAVKRCICDLQFTT